ncbi:MAG: thiamine phosphate synthase [Campylobacterota bacterium]|nr:thiamine phosphate synthase [Campylobacterota bacterium]
MIYYAISDPSTLSFGHLNRDLSRFAKNADMITYRDKTNTNYALFAELFLTQAREYAFDKILLHGDVDLASKLGADGVHLTSGHSGDIIRAKQSGLFVVISCHTIDEAKRAESLGADMITYSPIFPTPNKGIPLGLGAINALQGIITLPIIALGGILTQAQINACQSEGASGFASIRFFQ